MLQAFLANPLYLVAAILCLTVCIFVHELGHFLAARWRGAKVPRFSIFGLGKPIWSRKWRGVEWCICWIPFGAYVQIPQLADLGDIEGGEEEGLDLSGPPMGFLDKFIVAVAGPAFNFAFALALASVLWVVGQESSAELATTRIGYVAPTIALSSGEKVPSPAAEAGLQFGDTIRSIDGKPTREWQDVLNAIVLGSGQTNGERTAVFVVERAGQEVSVTLKPKLATEEKVRRIGISPWSEIKIHAITPDTVGAGLGFQKDDRIEAVDGALVRSFATLNDRLLANAEKDLVLRVLRAGQPVDIALAKGTAAGLDQKFGLSFTTDTILVHTNPFALVGEFVQNTLNTLWSLINPRSDIGLSHMGGPIGIVSNFAQAVQAGPRVVLWLTIFINVALAIFNLLPIPVLDGGHILFGAFAKLRGRPINPEFLAKVQFTFFVLLISLMLYVSTRDVRREIRSAKSDRPAPVQEEKPAEPPAK